MTARLTRKQRQQRTRSSLLRAAARAFARKGLERASVEEIAAEAGFTKGAFYANFASKEDLFLAMLDERFSDRIADLDAAAAAPAEPEQQVRRAGAEFIRAIAADEEWQRLFFEFTAYAAREQRFREELLVRYRALRGRIAEVLEAGADALGIETGIDADDVATMVVAMANGMALERLLDPERVDERLYATMLVAFFRGLGMPASQLDAGSPAPALGDAAPAAERGGGQPGG